ncbi:MAG: cytochrome c oxidase subunit II [Planctomycetota bacterium]
MIDILLQDPQNPPPPWAGMPETQVDAYGQLPVLASGFHDVDGLFYFTYVVCIFFFVLITAVLLYSVVAHRRKTWDQPALSNVTHNTPLEVVWTVIPLIIVMVMFAWGFQGSLDMTTAPFAASQNTHKAIAKQWNWTFVYPDGSSSVGEVWLEKNKPALFVVEASDVLHAFYIPAMRVKRDAVPGRAQQVWFTPTEVGDYHLFCAEYCGKDHSRMYAKVHVVEKDEYALQPWNTWPADDAPPEELAKAGGELAAKLCSSCHSFNGTPGVGPSWKGLYTKNADGTYTGRQREVIENGEKKTVTVDDDYITESIRKPDQKKVAEEPYVKNAMTPFGEAQLEDKKVKGIIQFMKSLAD